MNADKLKGRIEAETPPSGAILKRRPPQPVRPRLTIQGTVYFQYPDGPPVQFPLGYSRACESDESPYQRTISVDADGTALDLGWLDGKPVALVCLANRDGQETVHVVFGHVVTGTVLLPPGLTLPIVPTSDTEVRLVCPTGRAKVSILVIPS